MRVGDLCDSILFMYRVSLACFNKIWLAIDLVSYVACMCDKIIARLRYFMKHRINGELQMLEMVSLS